MPGLWDDTVKQLLRKSPEQFVEWLVDEASFVAALSVEIKRRDTQIYADGLFSLKWYDEDMLLHLEFQKRKDPSMAKRLLEYNVQASQAYNDLPVLSCVIYLTKDGVVPQPPFRRILPNGRVVIRFDYESIELWKIPAQAILETGLIGLFPLLTLTEGGKTAEVLDAMVEALAANEERDLLVLAYTLASLVFTSEADTKMLKRRFAMLGDILRDSWAYQEIMEEGREEGLQKGLQKGLQALRHILLSITQTSFPELEELARYKAALITEPKVLEDVTLKLLAARTTDEARQILNDISTVE